MPLMHRLIGRLASSRTACVTAITGEPLTAYPGTGRPATSISTRSMTPAPASRTKARLMAVCCVTGAARRRSPRSATASAAARSPGESSPSSLVMRISGGSGTREAYAAGRSVAEHVLHGPVERRDLAFAVVQDVATVAGRLPGRGYLVPDLDVLGHHALKPPPVLVYLGHVFLVAVGVLQLPALEAAPVHGQRHGPEQLDVRRVAVEHRGREERVVADGQALVVQRLTQPG